MNEDLTINSNKLRELRKSKGLTQEQISIVLGYKSRNSYALVEINKRGMSLKKLNVLAKFYNVSVDELLLK